MGSRRFRIAMVAVSVATAVVAGPLMSGAGRAQSLPAPVYPGCAAAPSGTTPVTVQVGVVACQLLITHDLGDGVAAPFGYYVPPECAPATGAKCPVLYLLHGFGGDYTEMVGTPSQPSAWVAALDAAPPSGFESAPWTFSDPGTWNPAPHFGLILVAPHGRTLGGPGAYGPGPGQDSYWTDWNPRYAAGGTDPRYDTPAPRFESFLLGELVPFVEATFPAGQGRDFRAIGGVSLGGFGSYKNGLQHPDQFTSMLSISGAHNFLFAPWVDPPAGLPAALAGVPGVQPPAPLPHLNVPAPTGAVPTGMLPSQAGTFLTALDALGDPVADQAYFRGNTPRDLALNAVASTSAGPSFGVDGFVNDTVPRRTADVGDVTAQAFEDIVLPMNLDMEAAFTDAGVHDTFAVHQGLHSDVYRNAWMRGLEEFAYARLQHADGLGNPPAPPTTFDYRTIRTDFSIWGWSMHVQRDPVEFLTMRSVTCGGLTLQGTGQVVVTVPAGCGTGLHGQTTFTVDLGPSNPVDEPAGAGAAPVYGRTVTIALA